jgi:cation diffusion facilitator family transporter
MSGSSSNTTVWVALFGNLLVAITKFTAALLSGSSGMLAEGFHGVVDTGNQGLMLYGLKRSQLPPDDEHPIGYGRELYFWSFIVALLLFGVGCVASIIEGIYRIRDPEPIESPAMVYTVLGLSLLFEGVSWVVALKAFWSSMGDESFLTAIQNSKDPPRFVVLLEDTAAIIGVAIVFVGTWASVHWGTPEIDGLASIAVGLLLGTVSVLLAREIKALLIGERADAKMQQEIIEVARSTPGVVRPNGLIAIQLAPDQVVCGLSLQFDDRLTTPQIQEAIVQIEDRIRRTQPHLFMLSIKPQSPDTYAAAVRRIREHAMQPSSAG